MNMTDLGKATTERPLILAVDVTGAPRGWISWQHALGCQVAGRVDRDLGDNAFTFYGGLSRLTGERSRITISSIVALRGRNPRGWQPSPPSLDNSLLFLRDRHVCCYCGTRKSPSAMTRDHIKPLSRGGNDHWTNVVTACRSCNQRKDARTPEEAGMLMLYVPYVPSRYEGMILRNRRILADQMEFLVSLLPEDSRLLTD
ncbi:HNH endonuclease [Rhodocyclus tenuis]|uniref:HNH endonuclease n=2 Tax=Rhodocyclus TaxID=1064 RepID=A0A6L5JWA4_RHOTE|nr:HNH endonuclease [Rhodocyclus gracilis]MQY51635.1 HNH endonuclease [Rhodocyclus gracilis]MRD73116.1 HNH endonuclease [Rhodocyclus gracilis]NJA89106.1 HNH endonuclease [Rhodocyclus gracilis]